MGTIVALLANQAAPGLIRSMIFVGGLPAVTEKIRQRLTDRALEIRKQGMDGLGVRAVKGIFSKRFLTLEPESAALFAVLLESTPPEIYLLCLEELLRASADAVVAKVDIPCLTLTGSEDQYAPPEAVKRFGTLLPNPPAFVEMPACGHMPFLENPEGFAKEITGFLDQVLFRNSR